MSAVQGRKENDSTKTGREGNRQPDPRAVEAALKVWEQAGGRGAVLFGSRARGDHRPDSDVDVMLPVAMTDREIYDLWDRVQHIGEQIYGRPVRIQPVSIPAGEFRRMRRSINHLAAIASREGVTVTRQPGWFQYDHRDISLEPIMARNLARAAAKQVTEVGIERRSTEEPDRMIAMMAGMAISYALEAVVSSKFQKLQPDQMPEVLKTARRVRKLIPQADLRTRIPLTDYELWGKYKLGKNQQGLVLSDYHPFTANLRSDVRRILANAPGLTGYAFPKRRRNARGGAR